MFAINRKQILIMYKEYDDNSTWWSNSFTATEPDRTTCNTQYVALLDIF